MAYPVLTRGTGNRVDMLLRRVGGTTSSGQQAALMGGEMTYLADSAVELRDDAGTRLALFEATPME